MLAERLRVAVDATSLLEPTTGVGAFTTALLAGLSTRPELAVTAFPVSVRGRSRLRSFAPAGVRVVAPPLPARVLHGAWRRWGFPPVDRVIGRHDVVHGPNFVVPPSRAARVATVHDLTAVHFPGLVQAPTLRYPELIVRAARNGAWIHTVSRAVRGEVIAELGVDPERVVAVANGFDPVEGDVAEGLRLAGGRPYVLAVGTVEPRKDLPTLVRAVDRLPAGTEVTVVHAGGEGWGAEALDAAVADMDHPDRFRRLGRVSATQLGHLYAGARLLAFPSVYEGFGLPVLEAMSADVPVVATDVPAVAEVAGDAALLCPVGDADSLAAGLDRAWDDERWREDAISRGRERCRLYSWEACVEGVVDLYRQAVGARA